MEPRPEESSRLDSLAAAIDDLRRRVAALESRSEELLGSMPFRTPEAEGAHAVAPLMPAMSGGAVAALGMALLGIAGAYLLRALVEYGSVPKMIGVGAGLLYAGWWLVSSTRVSSGNRFTIGVYGITSALILAPLLWETTVRFQVLPSQAAAAALVLFVLVGLALAWNRNLSVIAWITTLASLSTAMALIVATRALLPFTAALLAIAAAIEYTACRDHWLSVRWVVALAADFSVVLMTHVLTRPQGLPEGYQAIPVFVFVTLEGGLLATYLGSMLVRTLARGLNVRWFEAAQAVAAFSICVNGTLRITHAAGMGWTLTGIICLLGGAASYAIAFGWEEQRTDSRNFHIYATFGLLLLATASLILLAGFELTLAWCALAVIGVWIGLRTARETPLLHGAAYLVAAVLASGALAFAIARMIAPKTAWPPATAATMIAAFAAILCYATAILHASAPARWIRGIPVTLFAATVVCFGVGFAAAAVVALFSIVLGVAIDEPALATVRTVLIAGAAMVLAWCGWRFGRPELIWIIYPTMIFGAFKLLAQDFRQGRPLTLFLSLLSYGGALLLLPRSARAFRR